MYYTLLLIVCACRYVTLRRQRPQAEQQEEESTIRHSGETIIIEQEEEIKPIEIDVEQPISTSVRPRVKVSERPETSTSVSPVVISESDMIAEPSGVTTPSTTATERTFLITQTTESNTFITEAEALETEPSSPQPTTVPYQTSTLTSIVTVVVEGATERKRVPLTKLRQALAEHDLLANSLVGDKKGVPGKNSLIDNAKDFHKSTEKPDETNRFRPIGNYRGRPTRRPIVIEPPTTKSLPLYLQRRRKTTTELPPDASDVTESLQLTTKSRGRFAPSKTRERTRQRTSTTRSSLSNNDEISTPRTNRYRTARPSSGNSRFTTSRNRSSSPIESTDSEYSQDLNIKKKTSNNEEIISESPLDDSKRKRKFGNRDRANSESISEKPTRLFSRSRIRTTTENTLLLNENVSPTQKQSNRSRFVINRGRNQSSEIKTQKTRPSQITLESSSNLTNESVPTNIGGSRFQIQRRRKPNSRENTTETENSKININTTTVEFNNTQETNRTNVEEKVQNGNGEEHEIMISQENSSIKPHQLFKNHTNTTVDKLQNNDSAEASNYLGNISLEIHNDTILNNSDLIPEVENKLITIQANLTKIDPEINNTYSLNEVTTKKVTNESFLSVPSLIEPLDNRTTEVGNNITLQSDFDTNSDSDTFDDNQADEVLNVIASRYSEQSFTGRRGAVRFQGTSEKEDVTNNNNSIFVADNKIKLVQNRRRKTSVESAEKHLPSSKIEESDKVTKTRKVLVRKNKVTLAAQEVFVSTTEAFKQKNIINRRRNSVGSKNKIAAADDTLPNNQLKPRTVSPRFRNSTSRRGIVKDTVQNSTEYNNLEIRKLNYGSNDLNLEKNNNIKRRKVKVLKSRTQINSLDNLSTPNVHGSKRRVVVKKRPMNKKENLPDEPGQILTRRGLNRFIEKDLSDLDTGTSLYVQRETKTEEKGKGSFTRSVNEHPLSNSLSKNSKSRGRIKAKDSLVEDISGVMTGDEDSLAEQPEVG